MEEIVGQVIYCFCLLVCALAFILIPLINKETKEPIGFWSGDTSLKDKVKDVENYNKKMTRLYLGYGLCYVVASLIIFISFTISIVILIFNVTIGIFIVYKIYKRILNEYSK